MGILHPGGLLNLKTGAVAQNSKHIQIGCHILNALRFAVDNGHIMIFFGQLTGQGVSHFARAGNNNVHRNGLLTTAAR